MPTLDYQNPETPGGSLTTGITGDLLLEQLRTESLRSSGGGMLFFIGGLLVTMFMMLIPAGLIYRFVGGWFWIIYILCLACLVPFFVMRLRRDSGHVYETAALGNFSDPSSLGEYEAYRMQLGAAVIVDCLMWGPRMMIEGITMAQGVHPVGRQARLVRSAELLRQLAVVNEAISVSKLRQNNETLQQLDKVVQYLDRYDWVGASSDRRRVWLSSKSQKELPRLGVKIGTI